MASKKREKKPLTAERRAQLIETMEAIQRELGVELGEPAAPQTPLREMQKQLREHRAAMRAVPGGLIALDDERREAQLIRAIELARAPEAAQRGHSDGLERSDEITNAGLSGTDRYDEELEGEA